MTYTLLNDESVRAAVRDYKAGQGGLLRMCDVDTRFGLSGLTARVNVLRGADELIVTAGSPPGNGFIGGDEACALIGTHMLRSMRLRLGGYPAEHVRFFDLYEFSDPGLGIAITEYRYRWDGKLLRWAGKYADRSVVIAPGLDLGPVADPLVGVEHALCGGCHIRRMSPSNPLSMIGSFYLEIGESTYLVLESRVGTSRESLWEEAEAKLQRFDLTSRVCGPLRQRPRVIVAWKRTGEPGHNVEWLLSEPAALAS